MIDKIVSKDEVIDSLTKAYPKNTLSKDKNILHLDLSDVKYKLNDLDELEKDYEYIQFFLHLNTIDLNNNKLSILRLKGYNYLEKIVATNNMISKVELVLPKLKKLDLSSNMIDKVPDLSHLPNLEELRLSKNSITKISYEDFKFVKSTLNTLELSFNKIQFNKVKDFFDFVEIFGRNMRKLRAISVMKNPFSSSKVYGKEYTSVFIFYCTALNAIDAKTIEDTEKDQSRQINSIKSKILENERDFGHLLKSENIRKANYGIGGKNVITMENIKRGMERYQTISRMGQNSFKDLKDIIEEYINNNRLGSEDEEDDDEELEEYEKFLESCNVIIENSSALEKPLFDIVANFAVIKAGKFSDLSLTFFKHHLSSQEKAKSIEEVIERTIISFINSQQTEDIPASIISGLQAFSGESKFKKMILELVKKLRWIIESFKDVKVIGNKTGQTEENKRRNILAACLSFLSEMAEDEEVLEIMIETDAFLDSISNHLKNLLTQGEEIILGDDRGLEINIDLLNIIRSICIYEPEWDEENEEEFHEKKLLWEARQKSIKNFLAMGLKDKVEQVLLKKIDTFTKSLNESNNSDTKKMDIKMKEHRLRARILLGNFIKCYGALVMRTDDKTKLNLSKTSVTMVMLNIIPLPNFNDPVIISAMCDFILYIFENPHIISNTDDLFSTILSKLYSLKYVLLFLSRGPKYNQACFIAETLGQNTISSGQAVDFDNLTSEIMHKMFISVIDLITFFGRNAQSGNVNIQQMCTNVCSDLNDMDRDDALTGCLMIPSDEVKKAVANCLFYVDCDEFDKDEIKEIYIQISNVNLMAGDIEEVIATIYIILAKAFRNFMLDSTSNNSREKVESNKEAFLIAYDILMKNSERLTSDEGESEQKLMLSIALNTFLINCSAFENIRKFFSERKITTKICKILNFEETKLNELVNLPIEVEKTRTGWSMINLHDIFKNEYPLYPYSFVTVRVMIHIADMMMNAPYKVYDIPDGLEFQEIIDHLKKELSNREYNRIQREMRPFKDFINENKKNKKISAGTDYILMNTIEFKEEQYKFINLLPTILHFLLGKTSQNKIAEFEKIWEDKFDPKFNTLSFSLSETRMADKGSNKIKVDEAYLETEDIFQRVKRIMREESIWASSGSRETMSDYDHIRYDLPKSYKYGSEPDKMRRIKSEETAHNPYVRGLVIAAFLRSIWAVLEFPQEKIIKDQMIEILRKGNNIKDISMLVDSTKLTEFNIASKYLTIMRYVLFNSKITKSSKFNVNEETEYLNQIGVISFMIKKMINVNRYNIKIDNEDSKIFLADLSKCCAVIVNEVYNLHYSSEALREKTMSTMISYEIIKVFIKTVKEYMNIEAETLKKHLEILKVERKMPEDKDETSQDDKSSKMKRNAVSMSKKSKEEESLNEMIFTISTIIGEYMSKCREYSYNILESFTRSYIFDKVKIRKTYLREVIENCKMSDLKTKLEGKFNNTIRISFISRCLFNDFLNKEEMRVYMMLTETSIELLKVDSDFTEKEWELSDDYLYLDKYKIKFDDITDIFELEITNRLIIKTKKSLFGFYFLKSHLSRQIIETINYTNPAITVLNKVKVFLREGPDDVEDDDDTDKKEESFNSNTTAFVCKITRFGSIFSIFTNFIKEREVIPYARVLVIQGKKICIYQEYLDLWKNFNVEEYVKSDNGITTIQDLQALYWSIYEYDLEKLTGVTFVKTDIIILDFSGSTLELQLLDDLSYINVKKVISSVAVEKLFDIYIYENISK
jgi:hypothetical protein